MRLECKPILEMVVNVFSKSLSKGKHYNYMTSFALSFYLEDLNLMTPTSLPQAFVTHSKILQWTTKCCYHCSSHTWSHNRFIVKIKHIISQFLFDFTTTLFIFKTRNPPWGVHLHLLKGFMDQILIIFNLTTRRATCQSFSFWLKVCKCKVWCSTFNFVKNHIFKFHWEV